MHYENANSMRNIFMLNIRKEKSVIENCFSYIVKFKKFVNKS